MKRLTLLICVVAMAGCGEREVTVTKTQTVKTKTPPTTVLRTVTVHDRTPLREEPKPPDLKQPPPRTTTSSRPLPPAGVFQIGDKLFLVRPGFEANMHHLCEGTYKTTEGTTDNYVFGVSSVGGDFLVECQGSIGARWSDLPYTAIPQGKVPVPPPVVARR